MVIARSTDIRLVPSISYCMVGLGGVFTCLGAFMLIKCHFSKGKIIRVQFLWPNEDPVREMTICHPPQCEEKDSRTSHLP